MSATATAVARVAWSYSRLANFETCPKKFWHLAVRKDIKDPPGEQAHYGKQVHKAFELRVRDGKQLPLNLRYLERYAKLLAEREGEKYTEMQLAIDHQFQPCGWFDKQVWCRAIVDLAIIHGKAGVVVDYKTGRMQDDFDQLKLSGAMLMLYEPTLERLALCYLWTKDKKLTTCEITRADLKTIFASLLPRVGRYEKAHHSELFPARPGFLCEKYCPVTVCPHHGEKHYR